MLYKSADKVLLTMQMPIGSFSGTTHEKCFMTLGSMPRRRPAQIGSASPNPNYVSTPLAQSRVHRRRTCSNAEVLLRDGSVEKFKMEYQNRVKEGYSPNGVPPMSPVTVSPPPPQQTIESTVLPSLAKQPIMIPLEMEYFVQYLYIKLLS